MSNATDTFVDDLDLAQRARAGDPAALGSLLANHRADMYGVALSILKRPPGTFEGRKLGLCPSRAGY